MLSKQIKDTLIPKMRAQGIENCIFADLQTQPEFSADKNPYKMLMTVLKQYAGVVMGGYTAYVLLADREREIARLEREVERLTQKF